MKRISPGCQTPCILATVVISYRYKRTDERVQTPCILATVVISYRYKRTDERVQTPRAWTLWFRLRLGSAPLSRLDTGR